MDFCHREGRVSSSSDVRQTISVHFLTAAEPWPNSGHKRRLSRLQVSSPAHRLSLRVPFGTQTQECQLASREGAHMARGLLGPRVSSSPHLLPVPSSTFPKVPMEQLVFIPNTPAQQGWGCHVCRLDASDPLMKMCSWKTLL